MKINWGTGIVMAFIGFISFILFFIVRMNMDDNSNHELVTENYYKEELGYQKEIDEIRNGNKNAKITVQKTADGLLLIFPENFDPQKVQGTVSLYRPSNKKLDFDFPIRLSDAHLRIPDKRLLGGRWDIKVSWQYGSERYMHKERLMY